MSDRLRSALNTAIKVLVAGLLGIALNVFADVTSWVNGGVAPDLPTYGKGAVVLVLAALAFVVSAVIDTLKTKDWFPGVPPTFVKPPES
jgi:histidine ammonia-lyase